MRSDLQEHVLLNNHQIYLMCRVHLNLQRLELVDGSALAASSSDVTCPPTLAICEERSKQYGPHGVVEAGPLVMVLEGTPVIVFDGPPMVFDGTLVTAAHAEPAVIARTKN